MKITISKIAACALLAAGLAAGQPASAAGSEPAKPKPYPLETCLVADEKLGSMGKPFVFVHEGQEIKLCCKGCEKGFKKDPAKFMKKLEAAQKKKAK